MKWTKTECRPLATEIYNAINTSRLAMPAGKDLTARFLVGKSVWDTLDAAQRRFAGRFVSVCVRRGLLGLEQIRRDTSNHWRYTLA